MSRVVTFSTGTLHRVVIMSLLFLAGLSWTGFAPARASDIEAPPSYHEKQAMAESFLLQKLAVWQGRLSLQDWKITVKLARTSELKPKTLGNIHWDQDTKSAEIRVLDVADYKLAPKEMLEDMEFTIVHELIHLQLSSLPRSEASRRAEERAVNQIADALLKLDRKK